MDVGDEGFWTPVERDKVAGEWSSGATGHNGSVGEEEEGAAGEEIRAHAYSEFSFGFGVCSGMVGAGHGVALICVLGYHAAGAEGEGVAGRFVAVEKFVRGGGRATCVDEGIARSSDSLV